MYALRRSSLWAAAFIGLVFAALLNIATPGAASAQGEVYSYHKPDNTIRAEKGAITTPAPLERYGTFFRGGVTLKGTVAREPGSSGTCDYDLTLSTDAGDPNPPKNITGIDLQRNSRTDSGCKSASDVVGQLRGAGPLGSTNNGGGGNGNGGGNGGGGNENKEEVQCTAENALSWILCPIFDAAVGGSKVIAGYIEKLLVVSPLTTNGNTNVVFEVWQNVRNFANILFIFVMFALIYSQATSMGISAYGVKKMLPKLVAAAVLANLSFFICAVMVDAFNVLGAGISSLLNDALAIPVSQGGGDSKGTLGSIFSGIATGVAVTGAIVIGLAFFWGVILLAIVIVLLTLAARQALIIILVLLAPIAFAAWVLPNTEQYFKKWFEFFLSALLMYPLVMVVFAGSRVAANVLAGPGTSSFGDEFLQKTIAILVAVIPLIALPALFKVGGYTLGKFSQMAKGSAIGRGIQSAQDGGRNAMKEGALRKQGEYLRKYEPEQESWKQKGLRAGMKDKDYRKQKLKNIRGRVVSGRLIGGQHSKGLIRKTGEDRLSSDISNQSEYFDSYKNNKEKLRDQIANGNLDVYQKHAHIKRLNEMGATDMISDLMYGGYTDSNGKKQKAIVDAPGKEGAENRALLARHIASTPDIKGKNHQLFFQGVGMERAMSMGETDKGKIMQMGRDLAIKKAGEDMSMQAYAAQSHEGQAALNTNLSYLHDEVAQGRERKNSIDGSSNVASLQKVSKAIQSAAQGAAAAERIAPNLTDRQVSRMKELDVELRKIGQLSDQRARANAKVPGEKDYGDAESSIAQTIQDTRDMIEHGRRR